MAAVLTQQPSSLVRASHVPCNASAAAHNDGEQASVVQII